MPYVYVYQCAACRHDIEIVIAREFERGQDGSPVDYSYPLPGVYEWPPRRVSGLWSRLWCPSCRALRSLVTVDLEEPAEHPVQAFLAAEARGFTGEETGPCPDCGTTLLVEPEGAPCPECAGGNLICIGEYEP